ncbi:MAG: flavin reductase [Oscillospiraceae bacterium]|nr:flavin reductase [Oscillospiraceae bacterium]MBQ6492755.1 flavin reductase [Erysipelotrichaceae bacterium]
MKETINVYDYAEKITKALRPGILLNTHNEKFNSMVIGWGHLGVLWGTDTFTVYVRQSRYTKAQIDATGEFTLSVPLELPDKKINEICGVRSGRDIDKAEYLTLEEPVSNKTEGVREYPLTIECKVIYAQDQVLDSIPEDLRNRYYGPEEADDFHTMYIGKITAAYIIRED